LVVFLHGLGTGTNRVIGGIGGSAVPDAIVDNASAASMILISLNTRTASGFYANTPCGGPQEQDVLDAIAHEKAARKVSSVYLLGFSMGTVGAYSIAGHHPKLISGIGIVAGITDLYEQLAYARQAHAFPSQIQTDFCGKLPGPKNASVTAEVTYLSVARFVPTNFSGIPIYVVAGAADTTVPNNFAHWVYAETNSSFVNSTCATSGAFGEPSNCSTTFWSLEKLHPTQFSFRFVWESAGVHSVADIAAGDFFAFLNGSVHPAFLSANFPPTKLTVLPSPP
ncbi:MAG: alpha/beta hydrolase, partial [Thermoplasmata archaeon]|nr:alpha/beta hydrolase [Thermoplasmata archaeon]